MPAAFREALIFHLQCRRARSFILPHGALRVQRITEPGICINDHRQAHTVRDQRHGVRHLTDRGQANIGPPQPRVSNCRATQVERFEPGLLCQMCGQPIIDAGRDENSGVLQTGFQAHDAASN